MARKTREESLNTKNRILDAAELVLLEKGVGQTAMADIAEAAGMSRGAVYGHFNGKIEVATARSRARWKASTCPTSGPRSRRCALPRRTICTSAASPARCSACSRSST